MIAPTTSFLLSLAFQTGFFVVASDDRQTIPAAATSAALLAYATDPESRRVFEIERGTIVLPIEKRWVEGTVPGAMLYVAMVRVYVCSGPFAGAEIWMLQTNARKVD